MFKEHNKTQYSEIQSTSGVKMFFFFFLIRFGIYYKHTNYKLFFMKTLHGGTFNILEVKYHVFFFRVRFCWLMNIYQTFNVHDSIDLTTFWCSIFIRKKKFQTIPYIVKCIKTIRTYVNVFLMNRTIDVSIHDFCNKHHI